MPHAHSKFAVSNFNTPPNYTPDNLRKVPTQKDGLNVNCVCNVLVFYRDRTQKLIPFSVFFELYSTETVGTGIRVRSSADLTGIERIEIPYGEKLSEEESNASCEDRPSTAIYDASGCYGARNGNIYPGHLASHAPDVPSASRNKVIQELYELRALVSPGTHEPLSLEDMQECFAFSNSKLRVNSAIGMAVVEVMIPEDPSYLLGQMICVSYGEYSWFFYNIKGPWIPLDIFGSDRFAQFDPPDDFIQYYSLICEDTRYKEFMNSSQIVLSAIDIQEALLLSSQFERAFKLFEIFEPYLDVSKEKAVYDGMNAHINELKSKISSVTFQLSDLVSASHLNGALCVIMGVSNEDGRLKVRITEMPVHASEADKKRYLQQNKTVNIKTDNLILTSEIKIEPAAPGLGSSIS